jgi:hypothetical protein
LAAASPDAKGVAGDTTKASEPEKEGTLKSGVGAPEALPAAPPAARPPSPPTLAKEAVEEDSRPLLLLSLSRRL